MMKFVFLCVLAVCSAYPHEGSQLFRVEENENANLQREVIAKLSTLQTNFNIDFWLDPRSKGPIDFLVTPGQHEFVTSYLQTNNIRHKVVIPDVGAIIEEQRIEAAAAAPQNEGRLSWTQYNRAADIHSFLDEVAAEYPELASVQVIGQSTEGRDVKLIKIGRPKPGVDKPAIFMDGGMHAREWISPAIVTFFINELVTKQEENSDILDNVDFHIVPVLNIDGYEYSHTTQRLWRKTRRVNPGSTCRGVDPNRNFAYGWGGPGTSADPCQEIYKGPDAFSEPETAAMRTYIEAAKANGTNWRSYFAIHSYAQMWLTPWGNTYDLPDDFPELLRYGRLGAAALTAVHGTRYDVGSVTQLLSPGAGGSDDWAKGSGIFEYSQTVEVRDTGRYGFVLPPAQIIPTGEETWAGVQVAAREIM